MGHSLALLLMVGVLIFGGWGALNLVGVPERSLALIGLAYLAGTSAFMIIAQLLIVCGLPPVFACLPLLGVGLWKWRLPSWSVPRGQDRWVIWLFVALLVGLGIFGLIVVLKSPMLAWDAWDIWTRKARMLIGALPLDTFRDAAPHPDYPLGLPALEASVFRLGGEENLTTVDLLFWLFLPAGGATLAWVAHRRLRPLYWAPLVLALVALPPLVYWSGLGYADGPASMMLAVSLAAGGLWVVEQQRWQAWLFGLLVTGTMSTKNEAFLVALAMLILVTLLRPRRDLLVAWAIAAVGVLPWRLWVFVHDVHGDVPFIKLFDPGFLMERSDRTQKATDALRQTLLHQFQGASFWWWSFLVLGAILVVLLSLNRRIGWLALLAWLAALVSLLGAYWVGDSEIVWWLQTSANRVVLMLSTLLLTGALLCMMEFGLERQRDDPPPEKTKGKRSA